MAEVNAANEAARDLRAQRDRAAEALTGLRAEAQRLAGVRSTSEVRAAMDATKVAKWAWTESKQCTDAKALAETKVRAACQPILSLRQEMAKAIERTDVLRKVADAEAKLAALAGELHALGAEKVAPSKAKPFAKALGVLGFDRARVEAITSTFEPFAFSLLFELTAIVAFGFGFAHSPVPRIRPAPLPAIPEMPKAPTTPKGGRRGRKADRRVIDFSERFRKKHGRAPSGSEIKGAFPNLPTSTAYDYSSRSRAEG